MALMTDAKLRCADDNMKTAHQGIVDEERKHNPVLESKKTLNFYVDFTNWEWDTMRLKRTEDGLLYRIFGLYVIVLLIGTL